jgi:hypothetical protein
MVDRRIGTWSRYGNYGPQARSLGLWTPLVGLRPVRPLVPPPVNFDQEFLISVFGFLQPTAIYRGPLHCTFDN